MGWMECPVHQEPTMKYVHSWLLAELFRPKWVNEEDGYIVYMEVIKSSIKFGVLYVSARIKVENLSDNTVRSDDTLAFVVLWKARQSHGQYSIAYKDMDETCGPVESKAPLSLLKTLGPCKNDWSRRWRIRCLDQFKRVSVQDWDWVLRKADDYSVNTNYQRELAKDIYPGNQGHFTGIAGTKKWVYLFDDIAKAIDEDFPELRNKHIFEQLDALGLREVFNKGETPCGLPYSFTE